MRCIDKDNARGCTWMIVCEDARNHAAPRMTNQHVRPRHRRCLQEPMQLIRDALQPARRRTRIAPRLTGSVVRAHARELAHLRLYQSPNERVIVKTVNEYDGRRSSTGALQMQ